jgi:hypothetical protein
MPALFGAMALCSLAIIVAVGLLVYLLRAMSFAEVRWRDGPFIWLAEIDGKFLAGLPECWEGLR